MLKLRIIATLRFFALQDIPLTLFELHKYLLADLELLKQNLGDNWEVTTVEGQQQAVSLGELQQCIETECPREVKSYRGYYYLSGQTEQVVLNRIQNYMYAVYREQLIKRYTPGLRLVPFLRSIGLVGSQALGLPREKSDIDVLLIVEPKFLGLARFFVTLYFQILGVRRHGNKIANRFCLNHYLAGPKALDQDRNLYTAGEYLKARPIYHGGVLGEFKHQNWTWINLFFPNARFFANNKMPLPRLKVWLEILFSNPVGQWLEKTVLSYQLHRINRSEFVVVEDDELSFHPDNRKAQLFAAFFEQQQENHRPTV